MCGALANCGGGKGEEEDKESSEGGERRVDRREGGKSQWQKADKRKKRGKTNNFADSSASQTISSKVNKDTPQHRTMQHSHSPFK